MCLKFAMSAFLIVFLTKQKEKDATRRHIGHDATVPQEQGQGQSDATRRHVGHDATDDAEQEQIDMFCKQGDADASDATTTAGLLTGRR